MFLEIYLLSITSSGSKGNSVKALQVLLNGNNCPCGLVDGDFGTNTHNAVVKFQQKNKLETDGIVGLNTWKKILGVA